MLKNKIEMLLNYRNKKKNDVLHCFNVSSSQALTTKLSRNSYNLDNIILLCDFLDLELCVKDKKTKKEVISFDASDIKNKEV
ncbi:MAG: hypothetical protein HFF36_02510 [Coprobacillus sp.]|nr:hypothetical protein [Coprobacillus sp.]